MKRYLVALATAALVGAGPALGDAGAPGSTYPEQPGGHNAAGCAAVLSNPGTAPGGSAGQHMSPTAGAITGGLVTDACLGG